MARYRRRRFYKRKSGKWSANIQEVGNIITAGASIWSASETIMSNPTQQPTFVSQTYTVKNIEISFNIDYEDVPSNSNLAGTRIEGITAYIMYVPQGMNVTNDYNIEHPEYIMAYKYLGSPSIEIAKTVLGTGEVEYAGQQYQPYKVRTRLSRKLQTGDSVILFIKGVNQANSSINLRLSGLIRWWTKAN